MSARALKSYQFKCLQAIEAEKFQGVIFHCFGQYICIHGDYFRSCTTLSLNYNKVLFGKKN